MLRLERVNAPASRHLLVAVAVGFVLTGSACSDASEDVVSDDLRLSSTTSADGSEFCASFNTAFSSLNVQKSASFGGDLAPGEVIAKNDQLLPEMYTALLGSAPDDLKAPIGRQMEFYSDDGSQPTEAEFDQVDADSAAVAAYVTGDCGFDVSAADI